MIADLKDDSAHWYEERGRSTLKSVEKLKSLKYYPSPGEPIHPFFDPREPTYTFFDPLSEDDIAAEHDVMAASIAASKSAYTSAQRRGDGESHSHSGLHPESASYGQPSSEDLLYPPGLPGSKDFARTSQSDEVYTSVSDWISTLPKIPGASAYSGYSADSDYSETGLSLKNNPAYDKSAADTTDAVSAGFIFSDSGYASAGHKQSSEAHAEGTHQSTPDGNNAGEAAVAGPDDDDDTSTVYSDAGSLVGDKVDAYISELADNLSQKIAAENPTDEFVKRLPEALTQLLKAFSLRIGFKGPSQAHRDTMFFIYKHCKYVSSSPIRLLMQSAQSPCSAIVAVIMSNLLSLAENDEEDSRVAVDKNFTDARVKRWLESIECSDKDSLPRHDYRFLENLDVHEDNDEVTVPGFEEYRKLIFNASAYQILLKDLAKEVSVIRTAADTMGQIKRKILEAISEAKSRRISRQRPPAACSVTYWVDWDPRQTWSKENYGSSLRLEDIIKSAVTLTGSPADAQATSTLNYIDQIWPLGGREVLQGLLDMFQTQRSTSKSTSFDYHLGPDTKLLLFIAEIRMLVSIQTLKLSVVAN